jgi:hypothetical protein
MGNSTTPPERKPVAEDIPTTVAWKQGRRIYIRCGYETTLNTKLIEINATWDKEVRARYVGTSRAALVLPLIREHVARIDAYTAVRTAGHLVDIPYDATEIRAEAKRRRAVWMPEQKVWAMRTDEDRAAIKEQVEQWTVAREQALREQAVQQQKAERQYQKQVADARKQQVLDTCGRTLTGEQASLRQISTTFMNADRAWSQASPLGTLVRLADGRRGVIVGQQVWFTNSEMASSVCWHPETHDEAHWDYSYDVAIVEPTAEEAAADEQEAAERADAAALAKLVEEIDRLPRTQRGYSPILGRVGAISRRYGGWAGDEHDGGAVILTDDGRLFYQHPGWYDDYVRTETTITDPDLAERARALIADGPRTRSHLYLQQQPTTYTVTTDSAETGRSA